MQQLYFNDTRTYAENANELNSDVPQRVVENYLVSFTVVSIPPPGFTIIATPLDGTIQAGDGVLSIDNAGEKDHAGEPW
jgi:hypothetical protein